MAAAEKLSVTLTAAMVRDLEASVAAGEFASTSEALRDAVRMWRDAREERAERLASIKARLKASAEDNTRPRLSAEEFRRSMEEFHADADDGGGATCGGLRSSSAAIHCGTFGTSMSGSRPTAPAPSPPNDTRGG